MAMVPGTWQFELIYNGDGTAAPFLTITDSKSQTTSSNTLPSSTTTSTQVLSISVGYYDIYNVMLYKSNCSEYGSLIRVYNMSMTMLSSLCEFSLDFPGLFSKFSDQLQHLIPGILRTIHSRRAALLDQDPKVSSSTLLFPCELTIYSGHLDIYIGRCDQLHINTDRSEFRK